MDIDAQALLTRFIPFELRMFDVLFVPQTVYLPALGAPAAEEPRGGQFMRFLMGVVSGSRPPLTQSVGRVGLKLEAAGKSRLFMILDSISQRLLQPLHEWVFEVLRLIKQDGTFNQLRPLSTLKGQHFWSYDLRSATDRMPAEQCAQLLETLWGGAVAASWRSILYREFDLKPSMKVKYSGTTWTPNQEKTLMFTTGTPLGSLSAWGIFTLLHHLIVQQAAYLVTKKLHWFSNYAILGDDLVIGDYRIAKQYRRILKWMGVGISMEKSLRSCNGSLEFASRFIYRSVDLSPISFKLLSAARASSSQLWSFFRRVQEFRPVRWSEFARVSGAGYKVMGKLGVTYSTVGTLPKKWFRLWLLIHHPRAPGGLPWDIWLAAGRGKPLPVGVLGVLNSQLQELWFKRLEGSGWTLDPEVDKTDYPYKEEALKLPWLLMYLKDLHRMVRRVMAGELLDPYLDWVPVKTDYARALFSEESRRTRRAWSICYRLYDRVTRILEAGVPKALGP
jgi:hypothetical protein